MKSRNRLIYIAISLFVCGCLAFFLDSLFVGYIVEDSYAYTQMDPIDNRPLLEYYQINPFTILADIENGREDVYRLLEDRAASPEHPSGSFPWTSAEYLTIAKAHHLYLTGEPAEGEWKIFEPGDFEIDQCRDEMKGFDRATIIFYQREEASFPVTYIEVEPLNEMIASANTEYAREYHESPLHRFFDDPDAHFREAKVIQGDVSAEDALQIAENAGGEEMRQKLSNDGCRIRIVFFVDKWVVWYYWKTNDLRFTLHVEINSDGNRYKVSRELHKCERTICP